MSNPPGKALIPPPSAFSPEASIQAPKQKSGRRPRTAARPGTSRPDTSASGISQEELPEQQFFAEGEEFDEDEEYEDDEPEEEDVFAFARPKTGAVPQLGSDYGKSAPGTGVTGMTAATPRSLGTDRLDVPPMTADTAVTGGTFGMAPSMESGINPNSPNMSNPGNVDAGGRVPELTYDFSHPPIFSGKQNLNNSAFAFSVSSRGSKQPSTYGKDGLFHRRKSQAPDTADSAFTGTTALTATTDASRTSFDSEGTGASGDPQRGPRRMKSTAPLIPSTAGSGYTTTDVTSSRGYSRGSYGMTELTGDMTVPDGKTTWGDGGGGVLKEISEQGEDVPVVDQDLAEEDSPYPEVRASVSNIDDPDMPALTFRAWFIGLFFSILGAGLNTFFHFRNPSPVISPLIIQVITYPIGKAAAAILPTHVFRLPKFLGSWEFTLNPGPFNIKEHTVMTMMSSVAVGPAYGLWVMVSSELYYRHPFGIGFNIMFLFTTQVTGFAFAGLCRRFVVWPASMIWPGTLVVSTNLNALHAEEEGFQGGITRFRFLIYAGAAAAAYYIIPGFLFVGLSYFSWICWIAPNNPTVNALFGVNTGLGMSILTFDWGQISWIGSPLVVPWWAMVNIGLGFLLFYWTIVPILYFTNTWDFAYMPISVIQVIDRFSTPYNVGKILTPQLTLNTTAYATYSPVYLSAAFSMTFMLAFALTTALVVHTALHHGARIYRAMLNVRTEAEDIHAKLMKNYREVPEWWYLSLMVLFGVVFAVVAIEVYDTGLPVWGYFISLAIPAIYILPAAFIFAMTNQMVAVNLIAELIPGYLFVGKPIPCMLFKCFTMQTVAEAMTFTQNLKLGHYMKIPPRHTFVAQLTAMIISCFVQVGTKTILFNVVPDMCASNQKNLLTCSSTKVFFSSSIIWGLIGPGRLWSRGSMYYPQVFMALFGALIPIPFWLWVRRNPRSIFRNLNIPVVFNGPLGIPPATGVNYASWMVTGFVFQFWLRRRHFAWWSKYNYILSSALDVGTALSAVFIFLILRLPQLNVNWWGNTVYTTTGDWNGISLYDVPPGGFGPNTWTV